MLTYFLGMVTQVQTRCSVLAASNPRGHYDPSKSMIANTGIGSPLLSRFDLLFVVLDAKNEQWDRKVSSAILKGTERRKIVTSLIIIVFISTIGQKILTVHRSNTPSHWSTQLLRSYFAFCASLTPTMTTDAGLVLSCYFKRLRKADAPDAARTTVRLLESCIR